MSNLANVSSNHLLPDEIWILILLKIPIKSILICTGVCKSLNSLIKSPSFISSHLDHSISESNRSNGTHLCFFRYATLDTLEERFSLCLDDEELTEYARVTVPPIRFRISGIFGSCNGLILFGATSVEVRNKLFLWNPVVRKLMRLTLPDFRIHRVGLAFDSITNDYQVLVLNLYESIKIARYSLKSNSWNRFKDVESPRYTTMQYAVEPMTFVNGNFHLVGYESYKSKMILGFGTRDGVYREIRLPNALRDPSYVAYEYDIGVYVCTGLLSVSVLSMDGPVFDIWVMKEYGVEESWTLLAKFTLTHLPFPKVWSFRRNGDVLLEVDEQLMLFNPRSNMTKCIEIAFVGFFDGSFVESLALLNEGDSWSDDDGGLLDLSSDWDE